MAKKKNKEPIVIPPDIELTTDQIYMNNKNLKKAGVQINFTLEQAQEIQKCIEDPEYFIENYVKIVSIDDGLVSFTMYPYQKRILESIVKNRFTIAKLGRQQGKCQNINTIVKVRNKKTNQIETITMGDLYERNHSM